MPLALHCSAGAAGAALQLCYYVPVSASLVGTTDTLAVTSFALQPVDDQGLNGAAVTYAVNVKNPLAANSQTYRIRAWAGVVRAWGCIRAWVWVVRAWGWMVVVVAAAVR